MEKCIITIKEISFTKGNFDRVTDCTYVLLCCGPNPPREESVYHSINILKPTKLVKLVYNSGYKNCECSNTAQEDMGKAQLYIFEDALKNSYKRILFLEDDFLVKKKLDRDDIYSITKFIYKQDPSVYGLGNFSIPTLDTMFSQHQRVVGNLLGMAHAVMYNAQYMRKVRRYYKKHDTIIMHDILTGKIDNIRNYKYYKPLIYQTFPATDNQQKCWQNMFPGWCAKGLVRFIMFSIKLLKLDTQLQPGYNIIYCLPYVVYICIAIIIIKIIIIYKKKK